MSLSYVIETGNSTVQVQDPFVLLIMLLLKFIIVEDFIV